MGVAFIRGLGFIDYFLRVNIAVQLFEFILYFLMNFECSDEKPKSCYFIVGRK